MPLSAHASGPRFIRLRRALVVCGVLLATAVLSVRAWAAAASDPGQDVIHYLQHVIDWYKAVDAFARGPVTPEEVLSQEAVEGSSRKALQLAFEFGDQDAKLLASTPQAAASSPGSQNDHLAQIAAAAVQRTVAIQNQINQLDRDIPTTNPASRPVLTARRDKLVAALNLANARRDVLQNLAMLNASGTNGSLSEQVDELRHTAPDAEVTDESTAATQPAAAAAAAQPAVRIQSLGLVGLVEEMFTLSRKMSELRDLATRTADLRKVTDDLRGPARTQLMDAIRRGDVLTGGADTDDTAKLSAQQHELESLTARFTLLTNAAIPLSRASTYLQTTESSLLQWRETVKSQYLRTIWTLVIRVGFMVGAIVLLLLISQIWRRATFRYVTDIRRRRQFLLVRRLIVGGIIVFILIGGFVTEFGSLATYAGLLTAGIAVALQSVILSGVAHLFFLGRYGVRVGDRVTISGITGDVLDIGIFRMYMLELDGKPNNLQPTGRIVVFSNSVLFQPNAFYKQIPGAEYNWHELGLTLSPDSDYHLAETRLMGAVESVYDEYKSRIETQHDRATNSLHVQLATPKLQGRFRFVDSGLEFVVRYPVEMRRAAEIDDKITRKLLEVIEQEPHLKLVATSTPKIQAADGTAPAGTR